uniref:Uncharacterized protein LOC104266566 n=1 Tax=Phallusia mammillata TaxID=59560 RepID=A0A6F9DJR7_9ASCI|nr:uncharacterized protein LOC104266566 [Phallusia mammillata]
MDLTTDIHWSELSTAVRRDLIFGDFFNKFCCLPIFGQKIAYTPQFDKFMLDPPLLRAHNRVQVSNERVWTWLVNERLGLFMRSKVWSEYTLCHHLLNMEFSDTIPSKADESSLTDLHGVQLLDRLKWQRMKKVRDFLRFSKLVEKSRIDSGLIKFWIDADRLRFGDNHRKNIILRAIQLKYYAKSSPYCLPSVFLDAVYPERTVNDCRGFDLERTSRLKTLVLNRLHCYWLPRYLVMTRNDLSAEEKQKLKKYAAVWGIRHEAQVTSMALQQSKYGRVIQDPDVKFRQAQQLGSEHEYADEVEEEKHNILVREISGE